MNSTKSGGATSSGGCSACSSDNRHHLLHNVWLRSSFLQLCTPCVLKFHPSSFCPLCLEVFESPLPSDAVRCSKCSAASHSSCLSSASTSTSAFLCPSCANPSFSFFPSAAASSPHRIDLNSAKALLAAARIASASMAKAAAAARLEANRKVKEAALARKRAREALERAASSARLPPPPPDPKKKLKPANSVSPPPEKGIPNHKLSPPAASRNGSVAVEVKEKPAVSPSSVLGHQHLHSNNGGDQGKERVQLLPAQDQRAAREEEKEKLRGLVDLEAGTNKAPPTNQDSSVPASDREVTASGAQKNSAGLVL